MVKRVSVITIAACMLVALAADEQLARLRNLGKAFYENPTTQVEAVEQFRKALLLAPNSARERLNYGLALLRAGKTAEGVAELERVQKQDPSIPHTWFNLGIQYKRAGEADRAVAQFTRMVKLVPEDAISHYNLAASYKLSGRAEEALKHFEIASKLDSTLAGPHFQLFNAYRAAGRQADAARELKQFQAIKKSQEGAAIPEDMEWNMYAEVYDVEPPAYPQPPPRYTTRELAAHDVGGLAPIDFDGDGVADLLVWSKAGLLLYKRADAPVAGAFPEGPVLWAAPGDFNDDGWTDVAVGSPSGVILYRNEKGKFVKQAAAMPDGMFNGGVWLDYDHDYDLDLFLLGKQSRLMRNQGPAGFADRTADFPFAPGEALEGVVFRLVPDTKGMDMAARYADGKSVLYRDKLAGKFEATAYKQLQPARIVHADFDGDGDLDAVEITGARGLLRKDNQSGASSSITVELQGVKNLKRARHAEVEVKAGAFYAKQLYEELPLVFNITPHKQVDAVRITWPNGLIQNETEQPAGKKYAYKEAQRLSGSCPMIFSWNGREFEFVTDVLGVAPLGASAGDGQYFPVDRDEYIPIPRGSLVQRDGMYEIRITEELSEVAYLDKVALIAVDHPALADLFTNDKFKAPPFPEFRLFGVEHRVAPVAARQNHADVLPQILKRDRTYADAFRRSLSGVAEKWALEIRFPERAARDNKAILVLNGWVDWADGSTFLGKSQEGEGGLIPPFLQVRNERGEWQTVIEDMGIPAGKPKTIVVDLSGRFLSSSRDVRIVTNMAVYWDEIFLSEDAAVPNSRLTALAPEADLHFRGFSRPVIHPERRQPEAFLYGEVSPVSMWNQTPGMYTRYGAVSDLLSNADDRFVIMGSGDELKLRFDASKLPIVPDGWTRDFLLLVEGWAKDRDANTAFSQTVEPLPFRSMSAYPYPPAESFPSTPQHRRYTEQYNTRPALRTLQPLRPTVARRSLQ